MPRDNQNADRDKENTEMLTGDKIKELITSITAESDKCGFEVFFITKTEPQLRKMEFIEDGQDNLRSRLKDSILKVLSEKYNSTETEYVSANRVADKQRKFYIVETGEKYNPLAVLNSAEGTFGKDDIKDATGIAFSIRFKKEHVWAYQHLWSLMVPNKSKKNLMAKIVSKLEGDVFEEMKDPIIAIAEKIDLLVIDGYIVTSDYKLLQNTFGFQDYIRIRADKTIEAIEKKGIVSNTDKLRDYVQRGNGKPRYAKKMMRITDSRVLKMEPEKLWTNIHKSARWNGRIKEENGQFVLATYTQVEDLIDLLDERYTRSDITDTEYDTDVKQVAEPVGYRGQLR